MAAGTTVNGTFTITTFFTNSAEHEASGNSCWDAGEKSRATTMKMANTSATLLAVLAMSLLLASGVWAQAKPVKKPVTKAKGPKPAKVVHATKPAASAKPAADAAARRRQATRLKRSASAIPLRR